MTKLLRAGARTCTSFMTMIFQFAPLRRGIFLCFRIVVMDGCHAVAASWCRSSDRGHRAASIASVERTSAFA